MSILTGTSACWITSAYEQRRSRTGKKLDIFGLFQPNNIGLQTQQPWRPIIHLSNLNQFLKVEKFKLETPESIRTSLQQGEWVTLINFRDAFFHIPIHVQEIYVVSHPRSVISVQDSAIQTVHGYHEVHC